MDSHSVDVLGADCCFEQLRGISCRHFKMDKVREIFNYVPPAKCIVVAAWINVVFTVITILQVLWFIVKSLFFLSLITAMFAGAIGITLLVCVYFNKRYIDGVNERSDGKMAPFQVTFVVEIILGFFVYTTFSCLICLPFEVLLFKFFHSFYVKIKNENSAAKSASKGGNETAIVIDTELKVDNNQTY